MRKATVYLDDKEAQQIRALAERSGQPQSELIREAVRLLIRQRRAQTFLSVGAGSGVAGDRHWNAEALYAKVMGLDEPAR